MIQPANEGPCEQVEPPPAYPQDEVDEWVETGRFAMAAAGLLGTILAAILIREFLVLGQIMNRSSGPTNSGWEVLLLCTVGVVLSALWGILGGLIVGLATTALTLLLVVLAQLESRRAWVAYWIGGWAGFFLGAGLSPQSYEAETLTWSALANPSPWLGMALGQACSVAAGRLAYRTHRATWASEVAPWVMRVRVRQVLGIVSTAAVVFTLMKLFEFSETMQLGIWLCTCWMAFSILAYYLIRGRRANGSGHETQITP